MRLTDDEMGMFDGEHGKATQWAMQFLVEVGDYFGAEKMVDVTYVNILEHMSRADKSYLSLIDDLLTKKGRFRVMTTTDPAGFDMKKFERMEIEKDSYQKQLKLSSALLELGALPTRTCTMYWSGMMPRFGDHLAISETNAAVMFNSMVGARTNYESFPSSLASALTGKTPDIGFHLDENRKGSVRVDIQTPLECGTDWDALGFYVGKHLNTYEAVPVFINMPKKVTTYELKRLSAALATSPNAIAMFHAVGITPEASTADDAFGKREPHDVLPIGRTALDEVYEMFSGSGRIDLVHFGCPHLHLMEMQWLAEKFRGKQKHPDVRVWVFTSPSTKKMADLAGYTEALETAGCEIFAGACGINIPPKEAKRLLEGKVQVTDHVKHAYYAPGLMGDLDLRTVLKPTEGCVKAALNGKV
jgi:predicted aconitase